MNKRLKWACLIISVGCAANSDAGSQIAADAMTTMGGMISDAGRALSDGGSVLAQDADTVTVDCGDYTDWTVTPKDSKAVSTTTRTYFADVITETSDVVGVDARLCDREAFGSDPFMPACPPDSECAGEYNHVAPCSVSSAALLDTDKIRITCGADAFTGDGADLKLHRGFRWRSVEVHVRRGVDKK